jgi:hypothetical protein
MYVTKLVSPVATRKTHTQHSQSTHCTHSFCLHVYSWTHELQYYLCKKPPGFYRVCADRTHSLCLHVCVCGQARAKASGSVVAWSRTAVLQVFPLAPPGPRANHCGGWVLWLSRLGNLALVKTCTHSSTVVKFVKSIKIIPKYCTHPTPWTALGSSNSNPTFSGPRLAFKRPCSKWWRDRHGCWFTLAGSLESNVFYFRCETFPQLWSLEKEDTPHSFSSRVFLHYYKFYFFLFSTLYLVSSFL